MSWKPKQNVIVPIDFSDSSVDAVREGLRCAEAAENVHVVHVVVDIEPALAPYGYWNFTDPSWIETCQANATTRLDAFIKEHGFDGVTAVTLFGDAGGEITTYAEQQSADLIVIPSHGYHGLNRWLLGSTTERVLRHANCPVYVLRRKDAE